MSPVEDRAGHTPWAISRSHVSCLKDISSNRTSLLIISDAQLLLTNKLYYRTLNYLLALASILHRVRSSYVTIKTCSITTLHPPNPHIFTMGCMGSRVESAPVSQYSMEFKSGPQNAPYTDSWPEIVMTEPSPERLAELREPYRGINGKFPRAPVQQAYFEPGREATRSATGSLGSGRTGSFGSGTTKSSSSRISVPPRAYTPPHTIARPPSPPDTFTPARAYWR